MEIARVKPKLNQYESQRYIKKATFYGCFVCNVLVAISKTLRCKYI